MQTGEFVAFRTLAAAEEVKPPRTRRYAARSKQGCLTCRRRRVRCDESKPACQRCTKAQVSCIYQVTASQRTTILADQPRTPPSVFESSQEQTDFQFWIEIGGGNVGRWQCPVFYEQLLPQFSHVHDSTRYSLLALSTCVRQWHVSDYNARETHLIRGGQYYSMACKQLLKVGDGKASIEAALVTSLALFFYDSFTNNMTRRTVHSNAAISLLRLLKQGLSYNTVSGWRSESGKAGAQIVIEAAEAYLNDISYPVSADLANQDVDKADAAPKCRSKLYIPIWLQLDVSSVPGVSEVSLAVEPIQSPSSEWMVVRVGPRSIRDCHTYVTLWHNWLHTWLINTPITAQVLRQTQSLCQQWHVWLFSSMRPVTTEVLSMQNRALLLAEMFQLKLVDATSFDNGNIQPQLDRIMMLIEDNLRLSNQVLEIQNITSIASHPRHLQQQYLRGLAKVIEYVFRRAMDSRTRNRAYALFSFQIDVT